MNYYITHCDINFLKYAERLFETLSIFSDNKIIFYTIDFNYKSKFNNVIPIQVSSRNYLQDFVDYSKHSSKEDAIKAYNVFLKPFLIKGLLYSKLNNENNFCYLDADCLAIKDCDKIFNKSSSITDYPLFNRGCHDFMLVDGRGDPFVNNGYDLNYSLEACLMQLLNININCRKQYLQTGVFLFNQKCKQFIDEWASTCSKKEIIENWKQIAPFHEETVANCLLWKRLNILDLSQSLINLPYNEYDKDKSLNKIKEMLSCLTNVRQEDYFIDTFCRIPSTDNIKNLCFYHGKISDNEYNYIKDLMSNKFLLKINSVSLGDTLAATPTLRKLYNCYNAKIDVVTHHPELFIKNKYINKLFSFSEKINETSYKEIFNTFLGIGGKKSEYGVEKKHNTIDIRQFHAIDLGFMLNENEMQCDYIANEYIEINNLPQSYICLHVANTWPSRTYSDENWQKLINLINDKNIPVILIGKNSHESGFYNIDKFTKNLNLKIGLDLTNKLNLSQCWHVINKSVCFITMDSGLLHLAGTTDTNIIQLGSSINNKLRAPYRNDSQDYKYKYISGPCRIFCASDIKYGVKEWGTVQGVPPLINCLENKNTFECHPNPLDVCNYIIENFSNLFDSKIDLYYAKNKNFNKHPITLFLAPHLSTGGSPAYLKWLIEENIKNNIKPVVIEYCNYGSYEVQKKQIINLVGKDNFYTFGNHWDSDLDYINKSSELINLIKQINPSVIHLNEISEVFSLKNITPLLFDYLYSTDRSFKLIETCHTSEFNFNNKRHLPDCFDFCSTYHLELSKHLNVKKNILEMTIPNKLRPERSEILKKLNLNPDHFHVLNVGLFTEGKNQKYLFDLAQKLPNKKIIFHFIGNTCWIDNCGITEYQKQMSNCMIWNERDDVDIFMSCMDLFVFPSLKELNPISIKEALSWNMPCYINRLETYAGKYDNHPLVNYIENDNLFNLLNNIPYVQ